jgi:DNA repair exonuclease SbcCD nuclease subunit
MAAMVVLDNALYPGSPERVTFNEKDEAKGFYTIELDSEPVFHEIETRPMIELEGTPAEITSSLKDASDEAILKVKVHLETGEPRFEIASRWFDLKIEEIRPKQERENRLGEYEMISQLTPMQLLEAWFKTRNHEPEKIETLLSYAERLMEERQNGN